MRDSADSGVVEWYGLKAHQKFGNQAEAIVSVLASAEAVASIAWRGMEPVFADLDPETMSLTAKTVEEQVTIHTQTVLVTPNAGVSGDWEKLLAVTEPRGISIELEGEGVRGSWERIAPGVEGMGEGLLRVDWQLIDGGAAGFAEALGGYSILAQAMPRWVGKRRNYPGMAILETSALQVAGWRTKLAAIKECALSEARQQSFRFDIPGKPVVGVRRIKPSVAQLA